MVTASEGSPNPVMNKPFTAPSTAPSSRQMAISNGSEVTPQTQSWPITVQVRPSTLATERSISPVMTTSVIASAMSATGIASRQTNRQNRGLATPSIVAAPTMTTRTRARTTTASHEPKMRFRSGTVPPSAQAPVDAYGQGAVQTDRGQDQRTDGGALPERVYAEHRQRAADRRQQHRAERGPVDRAAPTEDGHAANDDRRDDVQLGAEAGVGVDRAEPGGVEHSGQAGQRSACDERGEDPSPDRQAGQPRRRWVRPDRVELAPAAVRVQVEAGDDDHHDGVQGQDRDAEHARGPHPQEAVRHVGRVDLFADGPGVVDASE